MKEDLQLSYDAGRERVHKHRRILLLLSSSLVGVVNLVHAYQHRSLSDAIGVVLCFFVLAPVVVVLLTRE
jgi:hypothetical protein